MISVSVHIKTALNNKDSIRTRSPMGLWQPYKIDLRPFDVLEISSGNLLRSYCQLITHLQYGLML